LGLESIRENPALQLGRLIHQALQEGYDTGVPFAECFHALCGELPDDDKTQKQIALGAAMLRGYQLWSQRTDQEINFIAMETRWEVKLGSVLLSGIFDSMVKRPDGLWVLDFKTTSFSSTDWIAQDLQATAYVAAARKMYGPEVRGIIFRFLLKKSPKPYQDLILKNGSVTQRANLGRLTTYEEYSLALAVAVLQDIAKDPDAGLPSDASLEEYAALLDGTQHGKSWYPAFTDTYTQARRMYHKQTAELKGESYFFWDALEYRTDKQIELYMKHIIRPAVKEMRSRRKGRWVGPTGLGAAFSVCRNCSFREPCKLVMDGADYRAILREDFVLNERYV